MLHDSVRADVLGSVIKKISAIEDKFPDVDFRPIVLGKGQVNHDRLEGARRAF